MSNPIPSASKSEVVLNSKKWPNIVETKPANCKKHGDYINEYHILPSGTKKGWIGCSNCRRDTWAMRSIQEFNKANRPQSSSTLP
jgi:hypothetical protein